MRYLNTMPGSLGREIPEAVKGADTPETRPGTNLVGGEPHEAEGY